MSAKVTKIKLYSPELDATAEYEVAHAERLLRFPRSGWELPKDSQFEFTKENGINYRRNKKQDNRAE